MGMGQVARMSQEEEGQGSQPTDLVGGRDAALGVGWRGTTSETVHEGGGFPWGWHPSRSQVPQE